MDDNTSDLEISKIDRQLRQKAAEHGGARIDIRDRIIMRIQ